MYAESITDLLFYADKWNIGFVHQTTGDLIKNRALQEVTWLEEEDSDYSADPFVTIIKDTAYIYYEFLNFWEGKGRICRISNFDFITRKQVGGFPSNIHLSYPYIFADEEKTYCIPETAEANEVALYEVNPAQNHLLTKRKILLTGASYLDSSIIKYNGSYWLFTSRKDKPRKMFIFYAATLDGEFLPHRMNPIACTGKTCRGAGSLFTDNGILYRPTQNLEHTYGGSIVINRIDVLSPQAYASESVFEIVPQSPYGSGVHTISIAENLIVIDGKRKVFSPIMPVKKINGKLKYLVRIITRSKVRIV